MSHLFCAARAAVPACVTGTETATANPKRLYHGVAWPAAIAVVVLSLATVPAAAGCNSGSIANTGLLSSSDCQATASDSYSTAVGRQATAGFNSSAFGDYADAGGVGATSVGGLSLGYGTYATAIGGGASIFYSTRAGDYATAIGGGDNSTSAYGFPSTGAQANGLLSVAVGTGSKGSGPGAIAVGAGSTASAQEATAVGRQASATVIHATAIGNVASATNDAATAVGHFSLASGIGASAYGAGSSATGESASSFGRDSKAFAKDSSAYGYFAQASGILSVAVGAHADAAGVNSLAVGGQAAAGAPYSNAGTTAVGVNAHAGTGAAGQINATAVGYAAEANAEGSSAFGNASVANGNQSLALGQNAKATKARSVAIGSGSLANVANAVSVGSKNHERRIVNVAAAVNATDAVNLAQVQALLSAATVSAWVVPPRKPSPPIIAGVPATAAKLPGVWAQPPHAAPVARAGSEPQRASDTSDLRASADARPAAADEEDLEPSTIVGWANVSQDGVLAGSRNITGNARHGIGDYEIVFKKASLRRCTYNATLAGAGFVSVKPGPLANSLNVETRNHYGVLTDAGFHLMAVC